MKTKLFKEIALLSVISLAAGGSALAADKSSPANGLSAADRKFAMEAAKGGMMEVEMGKMAENQATNAEVKKFGARMVADHGKANAELKSIASHKGIDLPGEAKSGGKWHSDKEYVGMMVKDHEKDLADFQKEAKEGTDPDLKKFAEKTSEVIQKHLEMVKDLDGKMK